MEKYHIPLQPGRYYHLFNHSVGDELLFKTADNFQFFLKKYILHTGNICDTFGYTLMPNHFHFAVKIKSKEECEVQFKKIKDFPFDSQKHSLSDFLMERFGNLCNSYTKSYNKVYERKGGLFIDYLKRAEIDNDKYFCNLINYIHFNAVHHGFCKKPLDWKWTSLHTFLANKKTRIKIAEVLEKFGSIDKFKIAHVKMVAPLPVYEFI